MRMGLGWKLPPLFTSERSTALQCAKQKPALAFYFFQVPVDFFGGGMGTHRRLAYGMPLSHGRNRSMVAGTLAQAWRHALQTRSATSSRARALVVLRNERACAQARAQGDP